MAALIRWNNTLGCGELALDANNRIIEGDPLIADLMLSIHTDAPADIGDPVPEGVSRPGNWAADFDPKAIRGSKLWMLRHVKPVAKAIAYAEIWTEDATRWIVEARRVKSIVATATHVGKRIKIKIDVTLNAGDTKSFAADVDYTT